MSLSEECSRLILIKGAVSWRQQSVMNIKYWPDKAHKWCILVSCCPVTYPIIYLETIIIKYFVLLLCMSQLATQAYFIANQEYNTPDGSKHSNTIRYVTIHAKKLEHLIRTWLQLVCGRTWEVNIICQTYVLDAIVLTLTRYKLANFKFTCAHTNSKQRLKQIQWNSPR